MSQEQKVDYEIMKSLNSLLETELQETLSASDFAEYKGKSKALLTKLLAKLEDNFEYQKYLEAEVKRLEEVSERSQAGEQQKTEETVALKVSTHVMHLLGRLLTKIHLFC
jgi:hypothetical protein